MVGNRIHVIGKHKRYTTRRRKKTSRIRGGCDLRSSKNKINPFQELVNITKEDQ